MSKNQSNKNVLQTNNQQKRVQVEKGIYYDNNTKNYIVSFFYGRTVNGKQQRHSKTFSTLQEARKAKKQFEAEKQLKLQLLLYFLLYKIYYQINQLYQFRHQ